MGPFKRSTLVALWLSLLVLPLQAKAWVSLVSDLSSLAVEAFGGTGLRGLLGETAKLFADLHETSDLAKAAYRGMDDMVHLDSTQLGSDAKRHLFGSFPEARSIYQDATSMQDLQRRNTKASGTLRESLYAHVYGPAVDYLAPQADNMKAVADAYEMQVRHRALAHANNDDVFHLMRECDKGEGACLKAQQHATFAQARILASVHEANLAQVDLQRRLLLAHDEERARQYYQHLRIGDEVLKHAAALSGSDVDMQRICKTGRCPYARWGDTPYAAIRRMRAGPRAAPAKRGAVGLAAYTHEEALFESDSALPDGASHE